MHTENFESKKSDRISIRLDRDTKQKIERAAALDHRSMSSFILDSIMKSADKVLEHTEQMVLSKKDWEVFYKVMTNPPKPNKALRKAWENYKKMNIRSDA